MTRWKSCLSSEVTWFCAWMKMASKMSWLSRSWPPSSYSSLAGRIQTKSKKKSKKRLRRRLKKMFAIWDAESSSSKTLKQMHFV